tara:strand:+ start:1160 stop:1564 length:405 start_codon:yes stop_codon:yes gene_type:complete
VALNSIAKWDNSSDPINNFILETRMYDFGSVSYEKKISSFSITSTSASVSFVAVITINYRINSSDDFTFFGNAVIEGGQNKTTTAKISTPIVCNQIQFQIKGLGNLNASIEITDMSAMYRPLRKYGSTSGDKES